jgi:hypothetical protein
MAALNLRSPLASLRQMATHLAARAKAGRVSKAQQGTDPTKRGSR